MAEHVKALKQSKSYSVEMIHAESQSTMDRSSVREDGRPTLRTRCKRFWREWSDVVLHIKYDEVDKQLETLVIFSTFMIGFSVLLTVGTFGPSDYAIMDQHNLRWRIKYDLLEEHAVDYGMSNIEGKTFYSLLYSIRYMWTGFNSCSAFFMVIMLATVQSMFLSFSGAAGNPKYTKIWAIFNMPIFISAYIYFVYGFFGVLDQLHYGAFMVFPIYDMQMSSLDNQVDCTAAGVMNISDYEGADCRLFRAFYDIETQAMIEIPSKGNSRLGIAWDIVDRLDSTLRFKLSLWFVIIIVVGYVLSTMSYAIFQAFFTKDEACVANAPKRIQINHLELFLERSGVDDEGQRLKVAYDLYNVGIKLYALEAIEDTDVLSEILEQSDVPAGIQLLILLRLKEERESTCSTSICC